MSKIFITGGTGFFGKNILETLLFDKAYVDLFEEIIVLSRNKDIFLKQYPQFIDNKVTFINGDVRDFECDRTDLDYILHLATDSSKDLNDNKPLEMMDIVINGTKKVLELAYRQKRIKKILFASSGAVYGNIPDNIDGVEENQRFDLDFNNPINAYAQAKRTAEMMCNIFIEKFNMPVVIARCFAFKGKYLPQDRHFAIASFIKEAQEKKSITILSDGLTKRSYMDVAELALVLLQLLTTPQNCHTIYNVGSEDAKTLKEWAEIVAQNVGDVTIKILNQPNKGYSAGKNYIPNIQRFINEFKK